MRSISARSRAVNSRIKAVEQEPNTKIASETTVRVRPASADDGVEPEFRSSRIEPMSRVDTNEFKEAPQTTLKMARWFETAGRPPMAQASRVDGRKWIESVKLAVQRAKSSNSTFDTLKLTKPVLQDPRDLSYEGMLEARHTQRVASAREGEERSWSSRHKPKSAGLSLSSASWKGPTCKRDANHHHENNFDDINAMDELGDAMRLREQALWLPVGDRNLARSWRPLPDRCGVVLYKGGPFKENVPYKPSSSQETLDAGSTPRAHSPYGHFPTVGSSDVAEKALELWNVVQDEESITPHARKRNARSQARRGSQQADRKFTKR